MSYETVTCTNPKEGRIVKDFLDKRGFNPNNEYYFRDIVRHYDGAVYATLRNNWVCGDNEGYEGFINKISFEEFKNKYLDKSCTEDDHWWKRIKVGDTVQCTPKPGKINGGKVYGGYGYKPNLSFKVKDVRDVDDGWIFFGGKDRGGVYHQSIVNPFESKSNNNNKLLKNENYEGRSIKVQSVNSVITTGNRPRGSRIRSRSGITASRCRHFGYKARIIKG